MYVRNVIFFYAIKLTQHQHPSTLLETVVLSLGVNDETLNTTTTTTKHLKGRNFYKLNNNAHH
jgi:hypothetical protein